MTFPVDRPDMLTWLADVARSAGLEVREVSGWRTRGVKLRNRQEGM